MAHTALTENPTKKPTIFTSIQTLCHQPLKKFHDQLKKNSQFCHREKIFFRSRPFIVKSALKTVDMKLSYNINNQKKTIKTKRKENVTLFGSTHRTATPPNRKFVMSNIRSKVNGHNKKCCSPS